MVFFSITLFEVEFKSNKVMNVQNVKLDSKLSKLSHLQGETEVKIFISQKILQLKIWPDAKDIVLSWPFNQYWF